MRRNRQPIDKARFRQNYQNSIDGDDVGSMAIRTDNAIVKWCPGQYGPEKACKLQSKNNRR